MCIYTSMLFSICCVAVWHPDINLYNRYLVYWISFNITISWQGLSSYHLLSIQLSLIQLWYTNVVNGFMPIRRTKTTPRWQCLGSGSGSFVRRCPVRYWCTGVTCTAWLLITSTLHTFTLTHRSPSQSLNNSRAFCEFLKINIISPFFLEENLNNIKNEIILTL